MAKSSSKLTPEVRSALHIAAWSALYFALHSLLASFAAKRAFARVFGETKRNGLFRSLYSLCSTLGLVALFVASLGKPSREFYHARGKSRWLFYGVQLGGAWMFLDAVLRMHALRLLGAENTAKWARGEEVEAAPEAQGPPPETFERVGDGQEPNLKRDGAFALCRNALNFAILPICWAWPRMNSNYAAFCSVTTLYCIIGSWLTERRLKTVYGACWERYKASGVPFFLPRLPRHLLERLPEYEQNSETDEVGP